MTFNEQDRRFMQRALELAARARGCVEPNPMVGAVAVKDGRIVAEGHHERFGGPHAEVVALGAAEGPLDGATLYVTLEPCAHQGKTPPCAPRVAESGVRRVVIPTLDPTDKTRGKGAELLQQRGIAVEVGLCREEAVRLNAGFFKRAATGRPLVIAKWAMSADGKTATRTGRSQWITSEAAREAVHEVRGRVDCIIVGGRTARLDDPLLTCRAAERRRTAARLVVCGGGLPAADCQLVRTASEAPVVLAYPAGAEPEGLTDLVAKGCEGLAVRAVAGAPGRVNLGALLDELGRREMTNVLVEGGGELLGSFFDGGFVDRVMAFVAPVVIGGDDAPTPAGGAGIAEMREAIRLANSEVRLIGPDALIEGWATDPLKWAR